MPKLGKELARACLLKCTDARSGQYWRSYAQLFNLFWHFRALTAEIVGFLHRKWHAPALNSNSYIQILSKHCQLRHSGLCVQFSQTSRHTSHHLRRSTIHRETTKWNYLKEYIHHKNNNLFKIKRCESIQTTGVSPIISGQENRELKRAASSLNSSLSVTSSGKEYDWWSCDIPGKYYII